jgi:hypothetical protein
MTYMKNEEINTKYEAAKNETVLKGDLEFNVKIKLNFPIYEKLKYSRDLEDLADQFSQAITNAISKEAYNYLDRYTVDEYVSLSDFNIEETFTDVLTQALASNGGSEE